MSSYIKGRHLEYRVRDIFKGAGFVVLRTAQSKVVDLVLLSPKYRYIVEVKARKKDFTLPKRREFSKLEKESGTTGLFVTREKRELQFYIVDTNLELVRVDWFPGSNPPFIVKHEVE